LLANAADQTHPYRLTQRIRQQAGSHKGLQQDNGLEDRYRRQAVLLRSARRATRELDACIMANSSLRTKKHNHPHKKYCLGIINLGNVRFSRHPKGSYPRQYLDRVAHKATGF